MDPPSSSSSGRAPSPRAPSPRCPSPAASKSRLKKQAIYRRHIAGRAATPEPKEPAPTDAESDDKTDVVTDPATLKKQALQKKRLQQDPAGFKKDPSKKQTESHRQSPPPVSRRAVLLQKLRETKSQQRNEIAARAKQRNESSTEVISSTDDHQTSVEVPTPQETPSESNESTRKDTRTTVKQQQESLPTVDEEGEMLTPVTQQEPPNSFDMRSIHAHPPDPPDAPKEEDLVVDAETWDASRVVFENTEEPSAGDLLFDTESWAISSSAFSTAAANADIHNLANRLMEEEKKEREVTMDGAAAWDTERATFATSPNQSNNDDNHDNALDVFDTFSWQAPEEQQQQQEWNDALVGEPEAEAPLLSTEMARSEAQDDEEEVEEELVAFLVAPGKNIPGLASGDLERKNRVDKYATPEDPDSTDDDEDHIEDDESMEGPESVDYVSYNVDDNNESFEIRLDSPAEELQVGKNSVPTFEAAERLAKVASDDQYTSFQDTETKGNHTATSSSEPIATSKTSASNISSYPIPKHASILAAMPPPPPPPESKRKKKKKKKQSIPLIAPPPEEKLKKWQESKMRPFLPRGDNSGHISPASSEESIPTEEKEVPMSPIDAARALALKHAMQRMEQPELSQSEKTAVADAAARSLEKTFPEDIVQPPSVDTTVETDPADSSAHSKGNQEDALLESWKQNSESAADTSGQPFAEDANRTQEVILNQSSFCELQHREERTGVAIHKDGKPIEEGIEVQGVDGLYSSHSGQSDAMQNSSGESSEPAEEPVVVKGPPEVEDGEGFETLVKLGDKSEHTLAKLVSPSDSKSWSPKTSHETLSSTAGATILSDKKMAERMAMASSVAALKFEEQYNVATADNSVASAVSPSAPTPKAGSAQVTSFFCGPAPSIFQPDEMAQVASVDQNDVFGEMENALHSAVSSPPRSGPSDKLHDIGLELVGGAFSPWKNSDYAQSEKGMSIERVDRDGLDEASRNLFVASNASETKEPRTPTSEELFQWLTASVLAVGDKYCPEEKQPDVDRYTEGVNARLRALLEVDDNFNTLCSYIADRIREIPESAESECNSATESNTDYSLTEGGSFATLDKTESQSVQSRQSIKPFLLTAQATSQGSEFLAANFVSFLQRASKISGVPSPFGRDNPFLLDLVGLSLMRGRKGSPEKEEDRPAKKMQNWIFDHPKGSVELIVGFAFHCDRRNSFDHFDRRDGSLSVAKTVSIEEPTLVASESTISKSAAITKDALENVKGEENSLPRLLKPVKVDRKLIFPDERPSPFELATAEEPSFLIGVLAFLGDPAAVCRMKMVNQGCYRTISENEHLIMRDAVRAGGLSMNLRPAFWMWIALEKCGRNQTWLQGSGDAAGEHGAEETKTPIAELVQLEKTGREGKWHSVIQRDVSRAFGNMPPHKTGARLRTDSIVRALVTWGRSRLMKRGVKGSGDAPSLPGSGSEEQGPQRNSESGSSPRRSGFVDDCDISYAPTDTVSDWSGVSPVGSFNGSFGGVGDAEPDKQKTHNTSSISRPPAPPRPGIPLSGQARQSSLGAEDLALSGNTLTDEIKLDLQGKLGFILHALAAAHADVGYCQGIDYVVAHLLRVLQDTIRWQAVQGTLPRCIRSLPRPKDEPLTSLDCSFDKFREIDNSLVVEETVFRVMDTFFTTYNLRHMYWPELRCLKTCCRVFERLIQLKLPVLADHFEHHDLSVGLFALGWFQTLFLYLPSMPSATVCHMWDIWLVERSFKIFFRVGTAILFLSQPILLNHELEGMMSYLNTMPDATLLNPDILIACALQIKVTNRLLKEIELEVTGGA